MQIEPVRVFLRDQALLIQIHRARDCRAHGNAVHPKLVAQMIGLGDGLQVVNAGIRPHAPPGFVFRAFAFARVLGVLDLGDAPATDHAGEAALGPDQQGSLQGFAARFVGRREISLPEVARRQRADLIQDIDQDLSTIGPQALGHRVRRDLFARGLNRGFKGLGVRYRNRFRPDHGYSLQVFRAHDGAHARTPGGAMHLVHDRGNQHLLLAGRTDARDTGIVVGLGAQGLSSLRHPFAPEMRGISYFDVVVLDPDVDGFLCFAFEYQCVVTGVSQLRPPHSAGIRSRDGPRQRAFGDHVIPAGRRSKRAGEGSGCKDQLVLRRERIDCGVDLVAEDLDAQSARSDEQGSVPEIGSFFCDCAGCQVDPGNRAAPSIHRYASWNASLNLDANVFFRVRVEMLSSTNSSAWLGQ